MMYIKEKQVLFYCYTRQELANFFVMDQIVNILGIANYIIWYLLLFFPLQPCKSVKIVFSASHIKPRCLPNWAVVWETPI